MGEAAATGFKYDGALFRYGTARWIVKRTLMLTWLSAFAVAALAQPQLETQGAESPAIAAGGNVAVTYGSSPSRSRS